MSWERRLQEIVLAGGALATLGCLGGPSGGTTGGVPCGNANPDPCICGRPEASAEMAALCDEQNACEAAGGVFEPSTCGNCASDGGVLGPHCSVDISDAGPKGPADASRDGGPRD